MSFMHCSDLKDKAGLGEILFTVSFPFYILEDYCLRQMLYKYMGKKKKKER